MQQRLPSLLDRPIGFAHRGARAHARENTLDAFALALRLGATGLESDAWLTADGVVVLDHDGVVRVSRRKRLVRDVRRDDLPAHIPTLDELLQRCGSDYHLSLDLKDLDVAGRGDRGRAGERLQRLLPRLWLCADDVEALAALRAARRRGAARQLHAPRPDARRVPSAGRRRWRRRRIDAVNLHHTDWTGGLTALFHRFERVCFGWDMQFEHVMRPALRMGIDGIFSDHVDVMVDAITAELGAG